MRKIIHIDMDCFFAAIEMRETPAYRYIPLAVGGEASKRGVISTANYMARRYGVRSAMSTAQALTLCPHLKVLPVRMPLYQSVSQQVKHIFARYTDKIEPISLDEAYLDVSNSSLCSGSSTFIAQHIRRQIHDELALTASAGVAPVKFLAKIASDINKPNGQFVITPNELDDFVARLPLAKIPGVGKVTQEKLAQLNLFTCLDVQHCSLAFLLQHFGRLGAVLYERCRGIDDSEVNSHRERKSIGVEKTLINDIYQWDDCVAYINSLYDELAQRLKRMRPDLTIARQGVKLKFDDFQLTTQEHHFPILDKLDLIKQAKVIWQQRRQQRGVRLIGLHVVLIDAQLDKQLILPFEHE